MCLTREQIFERLLTMPDAIYDWELNYYQCLKDHERAKWLLQEKEDEILIAVGEDGRSPYLTGKNAEVREAQMRRETREQRCAVAKTGMTLKAAEQRLQLAQNEFEALRSAAKLIGEEKRERVDSKANRKAA